MSAELPPGTARSSRWPSTTVARQVARRVLAPSLLWGLVFGLTVASSAAGYVAAYPTQAQRDRVAALFDANPALAALTGPARALQTVAGYTVWKSLMFLVVLGAVWGLLTGTRLTRGEEESGRLELTLAGATTRGHAAAQTLAGLGAGLLALWTATAAITVAVGGSARIGIAAGPALFFALTLVAGAALFLGVGALAGQLAPTRRRASGYASAVLGVAFGLRMVADSTPALAWLRWASPLGWIEQAAPLTAPRPLALLPVAALLALCCVLTVRLASRRDLGGGILATRDRPPRHVRAPSTPTALAVRLSGPSLLGWLAALALSGLLLGLVAKAGGSALATASGAQRIVSRLSGTHVGVASYLGVVLLLVAVLVMGMAVGQVSAARAEEASGRVEHLLVRPLSRARWLVGRLLVASAALVAAGLTAGAATWLGAATQGVGPSLGAMLLAGLNLLPPALFLLGVGTLVLGRWPRAAVGVSFGLLVWSLLAEIIGDAVGADHWLLDTSPLHHMAASPAVSPDWRANTVLVGLGVLGALVGGVGLSRRDLAGD